MTSPGQIFKRACFSAHNSHTIFNLLVLLETLFFSSLTYLLTYSHSVDSHYRDSLFFRKQNFFVCLLQLNHHLNTNTKANQLTRRKYHFISWWNDVLRATQINDRPACFVRLAVMNINSASHLWFWGWVFFCSCFHQTSASGVILSTPLVSLFLRLLFSAIFQSHRLKKKSFMEELPLSAREETSIKEKKKLWINSALN